MKKEFNEIIIFGAGGIGFDIYDFIKDKIKVLAFVDNDISKQGQKHCGVPIISIDDNKANCLIIIASNIYCNEIAKQLEEQGMKYGENYLHYIEFISLFMWTKSKQLWLNKTDLMITFRCTLKCLNCGLFIPYYKNKIDRGFDEIKTDIEAYFNIIDGVREFSILGGEPFLNKEFCKILDFIGRKYRDRIHNLQIITNATIVPNNDILELISKYNIQVAISDYSKTNPTISPKIKKFTDVIEDKNISYIKLAMDKWVDLGGVNYSNDLPQSILVSMFNRCKSQCRSLYDRKLYYCALGFTAVNSGNYNYIEDGFIELNNTENILKIKKEILKFECGEFEKGYIEHCKYCKGQPSINREYIVAAKQIK